MKLLESTLSAISPSDEAARLGAKARLERLTMPHWALGRLMDLAVDLAGMTSSLRPALDRKVVVTMAADHGIAAEGVSAYPQEVTAQMVANIASGGAGINALARQAGARVVVVDMGVAGNSAFIAGKGAGRGPVISKWVGPGTRNMAKGPAMTREEAIRGLEGGIEVALDLAFDTDVFGTGEMGIANTTSSSAIVASFSGANPAEVTGRGTGVDEAQLQKKVEQVRSILVLNNPDPADGLDVLSKVGGFEIAGIAGLILAAASLRKPVVVDGFASTAGALIAQALCPLSVQYMIASHLSVEPGHRYALELLGKRPLLDLEMRLGEGTGAAMAMNLVQAAGYLLTDVATFDEASVSQAGG